MDLDDDLTKLLLGQLAQLCAEQSERFFGRQPHDPRYCHELFRRALEEQSQMAWRLIYTQYTPLVRSWVLRHPSFEGTGEEPDYFINGAFGRLSRAIPSRRFTEFKDLSSILEYLRLCVAGEIVDYARKLQDTLPLEESRLEAGPSTDLLEETIGRRAALEACLQLIAAHLYDDTERLVFHESFVLDLKPREIKKRHPDLFPDVQPIYRHKENILGRLKRDDQLQSCFEDVP